VRTINNSMLTVNVYC